MEAEAPLDTRLESHSPEPRAVQRTTSPQVQARVLGEVGSYAAGAEPSATPGFMARPALLSSTARLRSISGERPRPERDSLRTRSQEGRPGTRKNKRYLNSRALVQSLRHAMAKCGEDVSMVDIDALVASELRKETKPSAFYQLLKLEGPESALEAWAASESAARERQHSRPRHRSPTRRATEAAAHAEQKVRKAFSDTLNFIRRSSRTRDLLQKLEDGFADAFSRGMPAEEAWQVSWDGALLDTMSGEPPAVEIEVFGLSATERKIVHQLAQALGLHSESRDLDGIYLQVAEGDGKALALRPPRRVIGVSTPWTAPFSVTQVLAVA
eukprot:TRINITY_DN38115_c0_g1_i1.p1 TRINITY_DN38115_c0_g1~~TRINITY_DN38115_c0_g1_i1.p1  ORF type:complete len:327 (-),score=45.33 TRINITY_DN38115_c0_g1_i1:82-1062(-)